MFHVEQKKSGPLFEPLFLLLEIHLNVSRETLGIIGWNIRAQKSFVWGLSQ